MFEIRYVTEADKEFWFTLDMHMSENELLHKIRDRRGYLICDGNKPIGVMRYNLFWDNIPFLTLIHLKEPYQGKGFGKKAMLYWENEMCELGYKMVMTSTQVDEQAQHFYRKLGYIEKGSLSFDNTPLEQPLEMFFAEKHFVGLQHSSNPAVSICADRHKTPPAGRTIPHSCGI